MGKHYYITVACTIWRRRWLRDYAHVRANQWPVGSPCLPVGQLFV